MSVYVETSLGDLVIDLFVDECPKACKNFLKLCKIKYYHNCIFHMVQRNFIAQTGDPTNTGKGGTSAYGLLYGEQARLFEDEIHLHLRHAKKGMVAMASGKPDQNASQFYITTGIDLHGLDDKHTIFGEVAEGFDVLEAIDRVAVDADSRPLRNIRIRRTEIFEDPFDDPPGLESLLRDSPEPQFEFGDHLEEDWQPKNDTRTEEEIEAEIEQQKAANRKVVLEMIGDRPEADAKPPEDMIFVCKLNPVTTEEDLETIFCRFGTITSCDIVRDRKTGDSLNYAFIGFDTKNAAEEAYLKMNNALVDDRRIKVDFSQSMYHLWKQFRRFGKHGDASMKKEADDHGQTARRGGNRVLEGGRYELTTGNQHGYGTGKYAYVHAAKDSSRDEEKRRANKRPLESPNENQGGSPQRHHRHRRSNDDVVKTDGNGISDSRKRNGSSSRGDRDVRVEARDLDGRRRPRDAHEQAGRDSGPVRRSHVRESDERHRTASRNHHNGRERDRDHDDERHGHRGDKQTHRPNEHDRDDEVDRSMHTHIARSSDRSPEEAERHDIRASRAERHRDDHAAREWRHPDEKHTSPRDPKHKKEKKDTKDKKHKHSKKRRRSLS